MIENMQYPEGATPLDPNELGGWTPANGPTNEKHNLKWGI